MKLLFFLFLLAFSIPALAQTPDSAFSLPPVRIISVDTVPVIRIESIVVSGNKKTKTYIILREIQFKSGDSIAYADIRRNIKQAHDQVYNTTLFSDVAIIPEFITASEVRIHVNVKEKWYIYPTPQFQLVDRNFNDWIKTYNADLDRVIYGAKFIHYNLSGRRDQLRIFLLNGYARNVTFSYTAPYSNPGLTEGFSALAAYTQNQEIAYKTSYNNKLLQYKNGNFVRDILSLAGGYIVRKNLFTRHSYYLTYTLQTVSDSIIKKYNPAYFNRDKPQQGFLDFVYTYQYANTNNVNYPLTGKVYGLSILKRGFGFTGGINLLQLDGYYYKYVSHGRHWYSSLQLSGRIKAPFEQSYMNQRAFGFGDFNLRGLEYYVVDGVAAGLAKYTLKKKLISFKIPLPFRNKYVPNIPLTIFGKTYADAGYSYINKEVRAMLNNRFLYTGGLGIDIISVYDITFKLEYSFNQLNEKGLFLQTKGGF